MAEIDEVVAEECVFHTAIPRRSVWESIVAECWGGLWWALPGVAGDGEGGEGTCDAESVRQVGVVSS